MRSHQATLKKRKVHRNVTSPRLRSATPHKTHRKAPKAQQLRCKDRIGCLQGCDGITKTTMWKKFGPEGNLANAKTFLDPEPAPPVGFCRFRKHDENFTETK
jgi:hypothetical protein